MSLPHRTVFTVIRSWKPFSMFLWSVGLCDIWRGSPFHLPSFDVTDPCGLCSVKAQSSPDLFLLALVIWWKTWEVRNVELHGSNERIPIEIVEWSREYITLYNEAQTKPTPSSSVSLPCIWIPPYPGCIKVNVDAAFPENSNFFRISMITLDDRGVTIWWARKEIWGRPQSSNGEAMAILFGIQTAILHNWRTVTVETDCLPVHRYLVKQQCGLVSYGAILDDCIDYRSSFLSLSFAFMPHP